MISATTFETKCYENDWRQLLKQGVLEKMVENCHYNFNDKVLFINNVKNIKEVKQAADKLIGKGVINRYYDVNDFAKEALAFFGIAEESFEGGYYYSIAELVSIYKCNTEFLLHFSSDSILDDTTYNWIDPAITLIRKMPQIVVANPTWNHKYDEAKNESFKEDENWYYSYGFSDQCYLIKTDRFKGQYYNEINLASERYPQYGGELFEKRVDAYMRNNNLIRVTSKQISYTHQNFPQAKSKTLMGKIWPFN